MTPTRTEPERELAHRTSDAIDISLYRNERTKITVKVYDARSDEGFELDIDGRRALDAFRHPFAYAVEKQTGEKIDAIRKRAA
jgi:hypothetical protein